MMGKKIWGRPIKSSRSEKMENAMPVENMKRILKERAGQVDSWLHSCLSGRGIPARLKDAMLYSLEAGGKRIRPVLCLSCAALCGFPQSRAMPIAGAIEMIHTYSLIHDDLPAMDDDDLRRGKPSSHKKFDEATAILAGDGLLTDSFLAIGDSGLAADSIVQIINVLALAAGSAGMVGGQMLDMIYTGRKELTQHEIGEMQAMKTGAMIRASCVCGALLAGAGEETRQKLERYGSAIGLAFQIADDILDISSDTATLGKPAGSDERAGKLTWPALLGLEKSRELALSQATIAKNALAGFRGEDADFLRTLADYIVLRTA